MDLWENNINIEFKINPNKYYNSYLPGKYKFSLEIVSKDRTLKLDLKPEFDLKKISLSNLKFEWEQGKYIGDTSSLQANFITNCRLIKKGTVVKIYMYAKKHSTSAYYIRPF